MQRWRCLGKLCARLKGRDFCALIEDEVVDLVGGNNGHSSKHPDANHSAEEGRVFHNGSTRQDHRGREM